MILKKNFLTKSECGFLIENMGTVPLVEDRHECTDFQISDSIMAKIINLSRYRKVKVLKTEKELNEVWRSIMEDALGNLMANGVKFDQRTELAVVPAFKIIQSILFKAHGLKHNLDKPLDQFIKQYYGKDIHSRKPTQD